MTRYVYCYKNRISSTFLKPWTCEVSPKDIVEVVKVDFSNADETVLKGLEEDDLYFIGTFDTVSGTVCSAPEFILDAGELCKTILTLRKENPKDGGEEDK